MIPKRRYNLKKMRGIGNFENKRIIGWKNAECENLIYYYSKSTNNNVHLMKVHFYLFIYYKF